VKNEAGVLSETHWPKKARKRVTILKNWLKYFFKIYFLENFFHARMKGFFPL